MVEPKQQRGDGYLRTQDDASDLKRRHHDFPTEPWQVKGKAKPRHGEKRVPAAWADGRAHRIEVTAQIRDAGSAQRAGGEMEEIEFAGENDPKTEQNESEG